MEQKGIEVASGRLLEAGDQNVIVVGGMIGDSFYDPNTGWVYNEDASEFLLMLLCVPCTLFFVLLGLLARVADWLAFVPAAFLLYRFIRVVKTTEDWDWD